VIWTSRDRRTDWVTELGMLRRPHATEGVRILIEIFMHNFLPAYNKPALAFAQWYKSGRCFIMPSPRIRIRPGSHFFPER
jgi:hypothetical protein